MDLPGFARPDINQPDIVHPASGRTTASFASFGTCPPCIHAPVPHRPSYRCHCRPYLITISRYNYQHSERYSKRPLGASSSLVSLVRNLRNRLVTERAHTVAPLDHWSTSNAPANKVAS